MSTYLGSELFESLMKINRVVVKKREEKKDMKGESFVLRRIHVEFVPAP